ncbi:MAG: cytochrome [Mycobacteriales bacterium]|nr:cytochrome [Mycobacteriales bacterium]
MVRAFGFELWCVFSPDGVKSLYALPEHKGSFGLASYTLLRLKVPEELFSGLRNGPHTMWKTDDVARYLDNLRAAIAVELEVLGDSGEIELFWAAKRLAHRMGLASWMCDEATEPRYLDRLVPLFEQLDAAEAFVNPTQAFRTRLTRYRRELSALRGIEEIVAEIWHARGGERRGDFLEQVVDSYSDKPLEEALVLAARDVVLIHLGSQSNMYAALAWTLVNLLLRPDLLAQVRAGDSALLESVANESIRLAQRSLTLRQVVRPVEVDSGGTTYAVPVGAFVTTMLSVLNTTAAPGLDRFDPAHYRGRILSKDVPLVSKELVSTFGHGAHTCPAGRFSNVTICLAVQALVDALDLEPMFADAAPRRRQIGGVARAERPCRVRYLRRAVAEVVGSR